MPGEAGVSWTSAFSGVITAAVTPMNRAGNVDLEAVEDFVEFQYSAGIAGLFVGGTTGEFLALDEHERRTLLEAYVRASRSRMRVIAHTGHVDSGTARRLTFHARQAGADAVCAITPYYFSASTGAIEQSLLEIAELVPGTPFFAYSFPRSSSNDLQVNACRRLSEVSNVAGVKLSVAGFDELKPYLGLEPRLRIVCGNDTLLPQFIASGGRMVVSGNAAAYPEVVVQAFSKLVDGTWDDQDQLLLTDLCHATRGGAPDRLKELLGKRAINVGPARVRTYIPDDVGTDGNDQAAFRVHHALALGVDV